MPHDRRCFTRSRHDRKRHRPGTAAPRAGPAGHRLEEVGPVPERAPVGHRARGLQRRRQCLELLHPRPGALARLPLGRGRAGRHQRRPPGALLRTRPVERTRPDHQGAPVRAGQQRGQPRRGRQGVLLLSRLDADALVHEVPVQVPAGGFSVRPSCRHQPRSRQARGGVRAARHRCFRREPLLRRVRRVRQGGGRGRAGPHHRVQSRPGCGGSAPAADAVVPQHLVVGRRRRQAAVEGRARQGPCRRSSPPHRPAVPGVARRLLPVLRRRRFPAVHRERIQQRAPVRRTERLTVRQGRLRPLPRARRSGCREPGEAGNQGGRALPGQRRGRRHEGDPPAPDAPRAC